MSACAENTCCVEAGHTERHHGCPLEEPTTGTILPPLLPRQRPVEVPAPPAQTPREYAVADRRVIAQEDREAFLRTNLQKGERSTRRCTTTADARCRPTPSLCHRTRITIAYIVADCTRYSCWLRYAAGAERSPVAYPSHRPDAPIPLRDNIHTRKMHACPQAPPT